MIIHNAVNQVIKHQHIGTTNYNNYIIHMSPVPIHTINIMIKTN